MDCLPRTTRPHPPPRARRTQRWPARRLAPWIARQRMATSRSATMVRPLPLQICSAFAFGSASLFQARFPPTTTVGRSWLPLLFLSHLMTSPFHAPNLLVRPQARAFSLSYCHHCAPNNDTVFEVSHLGEQRDPYLTCPYSARRVHLSGYWRRHMEHRRGLRGMQDRPLRRKDLHRNNRKLGGG